MRAYSWKIFAVSSCLLIGCAKDRTTTHADEAPVVATAEPPAEAAETYVSGDEPDGMDVVIRADADQTPVEGDFSVRSPERALEIAEAAVADVLDPRHTWQPSPALPASWPSKDERVLYFFYPMAANPSSMSQYQLFTPAYEVEIYLVDGTSEVRPIAKRRGLGVVKERRASLVEREELELAEHTLVRILLAGKASLGDNNLWGYLKYFQENPKFAQDIKRRSPEFVRWLEEIRR